MAVFGYAEGMKYVVLWWIFMCAVSATAESSETATFAAGCFWCMEKPFDTLDGVLSVRVGYTGGDTHQPSYALVSSGVTGHTEAVQIVFDAQKISYAALLAVYWHNSDPTRSDGQFCDRGTQYRPAIFYHSEAQKDAALRSKQAIAARFPHGVHTEIVPASMFWQAEDEHQHYYQKNPVRYHVYRYACGRDARLSELWGQ